MILENRGDEPIGERFRNMLATNQNGTRLVPYLTVGTGSQILKHANVGKMRLSTPMKFSAISGFDLEVVEYVDTGKPMRMIEGQYTDADGRYAIVWTV